MILSTKTAILNQSERKIKEQKLPFYGQSDKTLENQYFFAVLI